MREFYKVGTGSRRFGLELVSSDSDFWILADCESQYSEFKGNNHYIYYPVEEGIRQLSGQPLLPHWIITLFPQENDSPVASYLIQNADKIVDANRKYLYSLLLEYIQDYWIYSFESAYSFSPKMIAYRLLWSDIYINYSIVGSMGQAIKEASRDTSLYQAIRKQELNIEELKKINQVRLNKLYSSFGFFNQQTKQAYIEDVKRDLESIIGGIKLGRKEDIQPKPFGICQLQNKP